MKERKKQRWELEEERKPGASTLPESTNPDLKKKKKGVNPRLCNGSIHRRWTTIHPDEDCESKTTNQDTSLTILANTILYSHTEDWQ